MSMILFSICCTTLLSLCLIVGVQDFPEAEVLIVLGTSLAVTPFCLLVHEVPKTCARLLVNLDRVGERDHRAGPAAQGFRFDEVVPERPSPEPSISPGT
jgi:hypothetical protein